jgi:hypothetical protein
MDFDLHQNALRSARFLLAIFPAQTWIAVIHAYTGGDGVTQMFAGSNKVVVIQRAPPEANQADNHFSRAVRLAAIRWRNGMLSVWFRLGGRYDTHKMWIEPFERFAGIGEIWVHFGDLRRRVGS